ncbi:uncharacterized protein [Euphorbia lathyris]|uniref:uncharacterized protein n=1 Tax=Euphorbia lathyris TaxID=212925 RepID=UPI0033137419
MKGNMLLVSQGPGGALSARKCTCISPLNFTNKKPPLFSNAIPSKFISRNQPLYLTLAKSSDGGADSASAIKQPLSNNNSAPPSPFRTDDTVFVGQENVPLEGVIQFEKPASSRLDKWGRVALFAGGDVLALLLFSAIGRFSHGYSVFDLETLHTADPFVAGWFLGAYFLGGYAEDGLGSNGVSKAVTAAVKSWAVGIPLGIVIRAVTSGHIPAYTFMVVTMGSTAVLLTGWRTLLSSILPNNESKKNDVYRRGSPFELLELLTSLVRRW